MTPRTRNARGDGARLRDEIVDAAIALVDLDEPLTLRGIARQAGISAPSIYAHFADLAAITDAVLAASFRELQEQVAAATRGATDPSSTLRAAGPGAATSPSATLRAAGLGAPTDPSATLRAAGLAYVEFGWEHRARYRLMFASSGYAPDAVDVFGVVERMIGACVTAGESTSTDPHGDAYLLWVALHGMATLEKPARGDYLRLGPLDRPAVVGTLIERLARLR